MEIVKQPYIYENAFKNENGDIIEYCQLRVDVKIGDKVIPLSYKLRGFESEYVKSLISAQEAFSENDIKDQYDYFLANFNTCTLYSMVYNLQIWEKIMNSDIFENLSDQELIDTVGYNELIKLLEQVKLVHGGQGLNSTLSRHKILTNFLINYQKKLIIDLEGNISNNHFVRSDSQGV